MNNVFEPVRVKGKLMGKNVATGQFASKDQIRHIQLLNAEKNREVLFVSATGRVTRVPAAQAGVATTPPPVMKMSFLQAKVADVMAGFRPTTRSSRYKDR